MRDYSFQDTDFEALRRSYKMGHRRTIYDAPTGSGKTVVGSRVFESAFERGHNCWFIVHTRELADQAHNKLLDRGVPNNIFMAGHRPNLFSKVQVISIATFISRLKDGLIPKLKPSIIGIDECHRTVAESYMTLLNLYPEAFALGLTATPIRSDGRGLGNFYTDMVHAPRIPELQKLGILSPIVHYGGTVADLHKMRGGHDWSMAELQERQNVPKLVGDVVENWLRLASGRKTIVFSAGVKHSKALADEFVASGVRAAHIDGKTVLSERDDILDEYNDPDSDLDVICNNMVLTEGYDSPITSCVVGACPTKHVGKYMQIGGRGMRVYDGKENMLFLDHAGLIERHGFLDDPIPWTLDTGGEHIAKAVKKVRDKQETLFTCENCGHIFSGKVRCPECKTKLTLHGKPVLATEADLVQWKRGMKAKDRPWTSFQKQDFYSELLAYSRGENSSGKEYKEGWVAYTYRAKTGEKIHGGLERTCKTPTPETLRYLKYRRIRYAKQQEAEKRARTE